MEIPAASSIFGTMDASENPGVVFTSITYGLSPTNIKSILAIDLNCRSAYILIAMA